MERINLLNTLYDYIDLIENKLDETIAVKDNPQKKIYESMRYSVLGGGKKVRGILVLEFCKMCGGNIYGAMTLAMAVEMVHAYSLIHDDLPCMDDDDFRRGKPSNHIVYGEGIATLTGDALLTEAFALISKCEHLTDSEKLEAFSIITKAIGTEGMVGGQIIDIENSDEIKYSLAAIKEIYRLKTGALIAACCELGCIFGTEKQRVSAEKFGYDIGLAFQIRDDILDAFGSSEMVGKPIGSDSALNKTTFVSILGHDKAAQEVQQLTKNATQLLDDFINTEFIGEFIFYLVDRER